MSHVVRAAVLALGCLLAAPALAESTGTETEVPQDGRLTGQEALIELVAGRTQYGNRSDGTSDIEYHAPDGRSAYWYEGCLWRGQWWATEEMLCYLYPTTDWPGPHCFTVERRAGAYYFVAANDSDAPLTIRITANEPGNTENFPMDAEGGCNLISMLE